MAVSFQAAVDLVRRGWPDYDVAPYGYETVREWLLVLLPERMGARVPAVAKATGRVRWIHTYSPEYSEERPVGGIPPKP